MRASITPGTKHVEFGGHFGVDAAQEVQPFDGAVALLSGVHDGAGDDVEGGEQCGGAVADVVMGAGGGMAGGDRLARAGGFEGLDLRFLVHAQNGGVVGRIEVQADHIDHLVDEQRVGGELEGVLTVGQEVERLPDAHHGRLGDPGVGGYIPR